MSGMQVERGEGLADWRDECSVNRRGGGKFCLNFALLFHENINRRSRNDGISLRSPKKQSFTSGGCVYIVVPFRGALYGHVELERENLVWIHIQKTREYFECSNQVHPKSSSPQGMKAQPLQLPTLLVIFEFIISIKWILPADF